MPRNFTRHQRYADVDLGNGHLLFYVSWNPDRGLNPQYDGIPSVDKYGATIEHTSPDGEPCAGYVTFASAVSKRLEPSTRHVWKVEQSNPLTLSPSVLCDCGDHGFVVNGHWVPA